MNKYQKHLNERSHILDIGCGNGELLNQINSCEKKFGYDVYKNKELITNKKCHYSVLKKYVRL